MYRCCIILLSLFFLTSCGARRKSSVLSARSSIGYAKDVREQYASLMGVSPQKLNPFLYGYIHDWMGIPHRLGGQDKNGIDCSGFVGQLFAEVYNISLPRSSRDMAAIVQRKYDNQLEEGDLVFFSFGKKDIDHVGIYLHNNQFVHVSTSKGVIISNLKDAWYYKYLVRCGTPDINKLYKK